MIKSVTIKNKSGMVLFKVIFRKGGIYEMIRLDSFRDTLVDVRNEKNQPVLFTEGG